MAINFFEVETRRNGKCTVYNCDGYTTRKTVLGAVHEIGKQISKIDAGEGDILISARTEADAKACMVRNESAETYCFELEEVPGASRWDEEAEEIEYAEGTYYFHIRFCVWDEENEETENNEESEGKKNMENITKYNYFEAVKADVVDYIREEIDLAEYEGRRDDLEEDLNDMLWTVDSVTGNGSGSYTFSRETAKGYVFEDTETVTEALKEFDVDAETIAEKFFDEDWEYFDATARCYVLGSAIAAALDEIEAEKEAETITA